MSNPPFDDNLATANTERLREALDSLSTDHFHILHTTFEKGQWDIFGQDFFKDLPGFWTHVNQISEMFKQLKPLRRADREELWNEFGSICEKVKDQTNQYREQMMASSLDARERIVSEAERARPSEWMDRDDLKSLGWTLRQAGELLSRSKARMVGEHKQECFELITEIRAEHDRLWAQFKNQSEIKKADWRHKTEANIEKNKERLQKAVNALEACQRSRDELQEKIDSAWNDDWKSNAYGWLSELESKISDIEDSITRIEKWIDEDEEKLRGS